MNAEELARFVRVWTPGDRCRAAITIDYVTFTVGLTIPEGSVGTIASVERSGLVFVRWDRLPEAEAPTSPDCLDPVPS